MTLKLSCKYVSNSILFPFKEIEWKSIYLRPCNVTIGTNLQIFQYKILHNVLYLTDKLFKFIIISIFQRRDSKKETKVFKKWHILENLLR